MSVVPHCSFSFRWSECSRTCGGGVKQTTRFCDSPVPRNGGSYCTGRSLQYASCNTQSCGTDVPDFREVQCSQFDGATKNLANLTKDVQWVPKYGLSKREDLCKLFCRPKNSNAYYPLKDKVADGTKCGLNSFDICVNGVCRPGGCDNKLNSMMVLGTGRTGSPQPVMLTLQMSAGSAEATTASARRSRAITTFP
jgi:thrombospondin motif-containing protein 20